MRSLLTFLAPGLTLLLAGSALAGDPQADAQADALLAAAFGKEADAAPPPGRELFVAALESPAFVSAAVGPFDLHVRVADGLDKPKEAQKVLEQLVQGLQPVVEFVQQRFPRPEGLVSGRHFTLVFARSDLEAGQTAFAEVLALLDRCEDGGYSGWKPELALYTPENLSTSVAQTWEVLALNLGHPEATSAKDAWLEHGVGYRVLNFLSNLLLQFGAYGPVPPWLQQGLADELDIAVYGKAWVAAAEETTWTEEQGGWSRQGWEGFLPQGAMPPPPVYTPPPPLTRTEETRVADDGWIARADSPTRHWSKLAGDAKSDAPPSLQRAAVELQDTPRDRAFARLVLHLLLRPEGHAAGAPDLLEVLDHRPEPVPGGIRGGEPLTTVFARVLGGIADLGPLEQQTLREQLVTLDQADVVQRLPTLGGEGLLDLRDHREQSEWLFNVVELAPEDRQALFDVIVQSERLQQLREWEVLGAALDRAALATLGSVKTYPRTPEAMAAAVQTFQDTLHQPLARDG